MENINIELVADLLGAMEQKDFKTASLVLDAIVAERDGQILGEVEQIAQNLHDTLDSFGSDAALLQHTKHGLPDATERLEYVMQTTEEASNKTLAAAENAVAVLETLDSQTADDETKQLIAQAQSQLTEIMMAQSFQDLTGQVLNRVIMLVTTLEQSLHELIEKAGISIEDIPNLESEEDKKAAEMKGIGPNVTKNSQKDSAQSQEDVDDLLGELGI